MTPILLLLYAATGLGLFVMACGIVAGLDYLRLYFSHRLAGYQIDRTMRRISFKASARHYG